MTARIPPETRARARSLLRQGLSCRAVAERLGISTGAAVRIRETIRGGERQALEARPHPRQRRVRPEATGQGKARGGWTEAEDALLTARWPSPLWRREDIVEALPGRTLAACATRATVLGLKRPPASKLTARARDRRERCARCSIPIANARPCCRPECRFHDSGEDARAERTLAGVVSYG
jgi:hypothetical protein